MLGSWWQTTMGQLAGLHGLWFHCWGMNRPAWLFAQVMSFKPSSQVSGKGSLRFWSTAQDFVLIFFFKHWLCGDRSQQSSLSSKSSDYRILHLQHRGQETVGEVLGHFSLSLRENIWQGQKRTTSQPDHFPIHQHSFPLASCWPFLTGQAVYCSKLATGPPFYFSFMKLTFFGGNQATKHRLLN